MNEDKRGSNTETNLVNIIICTERVSRYMERE